MEEVARNFPGDLKRFHRLKAALIVQFPDATRAGFARRIPALVRTHDKDRHVLALAAEYKADLVSFNHRHFDAVEASRHGVKVRAPDDSLERVILAYPSEARRAVRRAYLMLRQPAVPWAEYIEHIRADGMPRVARWLAAMPEPPRPR